MNDNLINIALLLFNSDIYVSIGSMKWYMDFNLVNSTIIPYVAYFLDFLSRLDEFKDLSMFLTSFIKNSVYFWRCWNHDCLFHLFSLDNCWWLCFSCCSCWLDFFFLFNLCWLYFRQLLFFLLFLLLKLLFWLFFNHFCLIFFIIRLSLLLILWFLCWLLLVFRFSFYNSCFCFNFCLCFCLSFWLCSNLFFNSIILFVCLLILSYLCLCWGLFYFFLFHLIASIWFLWSLFLFSILYFTWSIHSLFFLSCLFLCEFWFILIILSLLSVLTS